MTQITELSGAPCQTTLTQLGLPQSLDGVQARVWMALGPSHASRFAVGFAVRWTCPRMNWLWIHVTASSRGEGVGGQLLYAAGYPASDAQTWQLVEAVEAPYLAWFDRRGFKPWAQVSEYGFDLTASSAALERVWLRLKGRIPPQAEMMALKYALDQGWGEDIARLQAQAVGGLPSMLLDRIALAAQTSSDAGISLDHSLVIVLGGALIAFALASFDPQKHSWMIDGFYVAPPYRDNWATLWLRYELVQTGLRLGRTPQFRVRARNDQTNTVAFARRLGAARLETGYLLSTNASGATGT